MTNAHLQLMSKPRLIAIIEGAESRVRHEKDLAAYWRNLTARLIATEPKPAHLPSPETTLEQARRILRGLPVDPHAQEHRDALRSELNYGGRVREPGARCWRGRCDNLLTDAGLCKKHDWRTIRDAKKDAA